MSSDPVHPGGPQTQPSALEDPIVISARNVGKCYHIYGRPQDRLKQTLWRGRRQFYREFWALKDVTFDVKRGQVLGLIGRNGSGKSTLLQILAGVLAPTTGEVVRRGKAAAILELGSGFNLEYTGRENALLNGQVLGMSKEEMLRKLPEIERFADIGDFFDQPVKLYSTGMYARLAFAVCVHLSADLLVVDEVLSVGDIAFQKKCYDRIRDIREKGTTIFLATHDTSVVRLTCDVALMLENGEVYAFGDPGVVVDQYFSLLLEGISCRARSDSEVSSLEVRRVGSGGEPKGEESRLGIPVPAAEGVSPELLAKVPQNMQFRGKAGDRKRSESGSETPVRGISGDLRMEVTASAVLGDGASPVTAIRVGGTCTIRSLLTFREPTEHFLYGVLIRDRFGQNIFGQSVSDVMLHLKGPFDAGDLVAVDFRFRCDLRQDTYFVTLGIHDATGSVLHYYATDVMELRVEPDRELVFGLTSPPFEFLGRCIHAHAGDIPQPMDSTGAER